MALYGPGGTKDAHSGCGVGVVGGVGGCQRGRKDISIYVERHLNHGGGDRLYKERVLLVGPGGGGGGGVGHQGHATRGIGKERQTDRQTDRQICSLNA